MRDILDENGVIFAQDRVESICNAVITVIERSRERITETKEQELGFNDSDEDEFFDPTFFGDELNAEYELLTACAQLIGTLMRTHGTMLMSLMNTLMNTV